MFIFRIIFNLFFGIFGALTRLLWFPISLVMHNFFLVLIIVAGLFIYHEIKVSDDVAPTAAPAVPPTADRSQQLAVQLAPGTKPVYIDPVMKTENGDSDFATDLYAAMTDEERAYYSQVFFYVMNKIPAGSTQSWQHGNIEGSFTPTQDFKNNDGTSCRIFSENLKVHTVKQNLTGIACAKGGGSWCKLKRNATPACGLSGSSGGILDSLKHLF